MEYKPNDVFIGLADFFGILLPGAMVTFLFKDVLIKAGSKAGLELSGEAAHWVAFVMCAYLFGQFVQLIAGLMNSACDGLLFRLGLTPMSLRRTSEALYKAAVAQTGGMAHHVGMFRWARAYIRIKHSRASAELDRLEAALDFFRGVFVVLLLFALGMALRPISVREKVEVMATLGGALGLSFWLFWAERLKLIEATYLYFIELKVYGAGAAVEQERSAATAE